MTEQFDGPKLVIQKGHRIQSITPMPQVHHRPARPLAAPPPSNPMSLGGLVRFSDASFQPPSAQSQASSVFLLARAINFLSIAQLREHSLPTGGGKRVLVSRPVIFLETFGQTRQTLLAQFPGKLKSLLPVEPEDSPASEALDDPRSPSPVRESARRTMGASPPCRFECRTSRSPPGRYWSRSRGWSAIGAHLRSRRRGATSSPCSGLLAHIRGSR
jgi:hypothetical protein